MTARVIERKLVACTEFDHCLLESLSLLIGKHLERDVDQSLYGRDADTPHRIFQQPCDIGNKRLVEIERDRADGR
jgi:hypothetical protein